MQSPEKKRNMFSLNRQITKIILIIYVLFFSVIALFLFNSILNYQEKRNERIENALQNSMNQINDSIDSMKTQTLRIYNSSKDLYLLEDYVNNTVNFDSLINLKNELDETHTVVGKNDSIWVFYDDFRQNLYKSGTTRVEEIEEMKADCKNLLHMVGDNYGSQIFSYTDHSYYAIYYKKNRVAVAGLIELTGLLPGISGYETGIVCKGALYSEGGVSSFCAEELQASPAVTDDSVVYYIQNEKYGIGVAAWRKNTLWLYMRPAHFLAYCILLLTIVPMISFIRLLHRRLIIPLRDMTDTMYRIQEGIFTNFQSDTNVEEIEEVKKSIQTMTEEIISWQRRTYEEKMERQTIQMQYLQLQLGPHFYLNCLKNANAALMVGKYDYVQEYLIRVSNHLRYLMRDCMDFVSLEQELEFVSNYLQMMGMERQCEISYEENGRHCLIPVLAVQLFVENSIKYAVSVASELRICVSVRRLQTDEGNFLNIVISDNGRGYPPAMLELLNASELSGQSEHIGILNLKNRMKLLYGDQAQCYFSNHGGAVSDLLLLYREENDHEDSDRG